MKKFVKQFVSKNSGSLAFGQPVLQNIECVQDDVNQKIDALINAKDDDERHRIKIDILREFNEVYQYDCETAQWPCGEECGVTDKVRKNKILLQDLGLYLGNIFTFFHKEYTLKTGIPMMWSDTFTDYGELYWHAANEYFARLNGNYVSIYVRLQRGENIDNSFVNAIETKYTTTENVYLTSFAFPALIESRLDIQLKNKILNAVLMKIRDKDILELAEEQRQLLQIFRKKNGGTITFAEPRAIVLGKLWGALCRLNAVDKILDKKSKEIIENERTSLHEILESGYMKSHILQEYQMLFRWLFDADYLNLRNITMHGANVSFNNFSIKIGAVLLQLFWDVCRHEIYRDAKREIA